MGKILNPPEPEHRHENHAYRAEPDEMYFDGPGKSLVDALGWVPFTLYHEVRECQRHGCDTTEVRKYCYHLDDVTEYCGHGHREEIGAFADVVDYNDGVVIELSCPTGDCEYSERIQPRETKVNVKYAGACTGAPRKPSPF